MAALHEALTNLSPTDWSDVPQDNLKSYVEGILKASELICNSIPPPPNGVSFADSKPFSTQSDTATSHTDMHASTARPPPPVPEFEELQSQWAKPMKFSAKENPLEVSLYKMAGKDRHGGWFARRSVHEGLGFTRFRQAMSQEFETSLKVEGGPGAGAIRGLAADKKLEKHEVEGVGCVEVLQLSAQFPGPTTPREFITLLITSDSAPAAKSVAGEGISSAPIARNYIIVSRPVKHPNAPERSGHIRGQYESVELIREIPLNRSATKSTSTLPTTAAHDSSSKDLPGTSDESELNPVEWIMITRSDPGGGIPRFMVDRGTPSAMISDVHKFLDWATTFTTVPGSRDPTLDIHPAPIDEKVVQPSPQTVTTAAQPTPVPNGIFQQLTSTLEAGLDAYAPTMISSYVHDRLDPEGSSSSSSESKPSEASDADSFTSATEKRHASVGEAMPRDSSDSITLASLAAASESGDKSQLDTHGKKLLEIGKEHEKLERKSAKKREDEELRLQRAQEDENSETAKAQERYDKEMKKQDERHRKELEKLEAKKEKEIKKLQEKKQKQLDRDIVHKLTRERDEFRSQVDLLKKENTILRERIDQVESQGSALEQ